MKIIGLTGGIGMGKSTAANAFKRARIPVFDADLAVHKLQARGGKAVRAIEAAFPGTTRNGAVDRPALRHAVLGKPEALRRLEHILVLDIPLLFEIGAETRMDKVIVVSAPRDVQIHRVRLRRRMSAADIAAVIARQMPDAEKRRRADVVVRTGLSRHHTQRALRRLVRELRA
jgi:dephospho-CoA kinase